MPQTKDGAKPPTESADKQLKPPQYLQPGDEVGATIDGIGEMRHTFVSA